MTTVTTQLDWELIVKLKTGVEITLDIVDAQLFLQEHTDKDNPRKEIDSFRSWLESLGEGLKVSFSEAHNIALIVVKEFNSLKKKFERELQLLTATGNQPSSLNETNKESIE